MGNFSRFCTCICYIFFGGMGCICSVSRQPLCNVRKSCRPLWWTLRMAHTAPYRVNLAKCTVHDTRIISSRDSLRTPTQHCAVLKRSIRIGVSPFGKQTDAKTMPPRTQWKGERRDDFRTSVRIRRPARSLAVSFVT